MAEEKRGPYGLDPSQYPKRLGQPWKEGEIKRLLCSIQQKKSVEEIAEEHQRTVSGIQCYIKKLAVEYHVHHNMPMEEIERSTGLTREQIEDAIQKQGQKQEQKQGQKQEQKGKNTGAKEPKEPKESKKPKEPTMAEMALLLTDIQAKLAMLLERVA